MLDNEKTKEKLLTNSVVLIVDADEKNRQRLCHMFESFGFCNVFSAQSDEDIWKLVAHNVPDIIIIDIYSPTIKGFELVKKIREHVECEDVPIIAQTESTSAKNKAKIFEAGITDYISKPVDFYEIYARSIIHLEKGHQNKELRKFYKRLKGELSAAQSLIDDSLPSDDSIKRLRRDYKVDLSVEFKSTSEMGGDLWGFFRVDENRLGVYTIDLAGHGIESCLNALRMHSIMHSNLIQYDDLEKVVSWINKKMCKLLPVGKFATMFCGLIDTKNDILTYTTAATTSPAILTKESEKAILLSGQGYPIGVQEDFKYKTESVKFGVGDTLVLYSDAIIEENSKDGEIFGEKNLYDIFDMIVESKNYKSDNVLNTILENFYKKCSKNLKDDLTINVYHRMS